MNYAPMGKVDHPASCESERHIDAPVIRWRDGNTDGDCSVGSDGDSIVHYLTDANMNVTTLLDATDGTVLERYAYDAYGKVTFLKADWTLQQVSGHADGTASAYDNEVLFTGQRYDPETGLYLFRERVYLPHLGRFAQRDLPAFADDGSLYQYARSNTPAARDPSGWKTLASEKNVVGQPHGVKRAFDLKLHDIGDGKCILRLTMKLQFFFSDYKGNVWTEEEKQQWISRYAQAVKQAWERKHTIDLVEGDPECCKCSKGTELEINLKTWQGGWSVSEHWEVSVSKEVGEGEQARAATRWTLGNVELYVQDINPRTIQDKTPMGEVLATYEQRPVVHECGHMMGLEEDYDMQTGPLGRSGVMYWGEEISTQDYQQFADWMNKKSRKFNDDRHDCKYGFSHPTSRR